jgi:hypothetical protein
METKSNFTTFLFRKEGNVWDIAIYMPKSEAEAFLEHKDKRVLCTINNEHSIHCALTPQGNGDFFINTNKDLRNKLKLELDDKVAIVLEKDTSKYGMPLPKELETAWELDPEGYEAFHTLTVGTQRSLVYIIGKPKSSDNRII